MGKEARKGDNFLKVVTFIDLDYNMESLFGQVGKNQ
jgi:hypothetical protein